jgi:phage shock protein A
MFRRFLAAIRSFLGLFIRGLEKPEVMLQQYIDDMRAQVPKLNDTVAEVMKHEVLLRNRIEKLQKEIADLDKQIIAAVKLGPQYEEEAKMLIQRMEDAKRDLEETKVQYEAAQKASAQAKLAREDYIRTMNQKIQEAMRAISRAKQAEMQERLAGLMMSFNQGDQSDTLERMTEKIEERAAKAQAKVELATSGVDARMQEIRRATVSSEVEEKLLEYKRQLGLAPPEEDATKTMQPIPEQPESTGN